MTADGSTMMKLIMFYGKSLIVLFDKETVALTSFLHLVNRSFRLAAIVYGGSVVCANALMYCLQVRCMLKLRHPVSAVYPGLKTLANTVAHSTAHSSKSPSQVFQY